MMLRTWQKTIWTCIGLLVTACFLFPVYWIVVTSLKKDAELLRTPPSLFPLQINWQPYLDTVIKNQDVWHYLANSVWIAAGTMFVSLVLGAPAAYGFARLPLQGKRACLFLLLVMQMFPSIMLALPLFTMFVQMHLINSLPAVILATSTRTLPFAILVLRPFFLTLPHDLEDAAAVDGCGLWRAFLQIIVPLSTPGLVSVSILTFLTGWSEFLFPLALLTDESKRPLTMGLYKFISYYGTSWNNLMAFALLTALPVVIVLIFAQRYITAGFTAGAVKE